MPATPKPAESDPFAVTALPLLNFGWAAIDSTD